VAGLGLRYSKDLNVKMKDAKEACFYSILGLEKTCSTSDVRCAYRKLAKKWHPDKLNVKDSAAADSATASEAAKMRFQAIQEAYSVLSDNNKRLMYDAGVYDDDDDELGMSSFVGEIATMMAGSKQEHQDDALENLDELKAMFLNIVNDDYCKPSTSNKRSNSCLSGKVDGKHWKGTTSSSCEFDQDFLMNGFHSEVASLGSDNDTSCMGGDGVDSLQELKQVFMNIVDPEFYASACSKMTFSISSNQNNNKSHWMNGPTTFDELVAETLFPEDGIIGSMLDRSAPGNKSSVDLCGEVSNTTSAATVDKRHSKKLKICQEQRDDTDPLWESDFTYHWSSGFC
jgi:curved DNA-binding protein CbpA